MKIILKIFLIIIFPFTTFSIKTTLAQENEFNADTSNCERELRNILAPDFSCLVPVNLTNKGQTKFLRETFGIIKDMKCNIEIFIEKRSIFGEIIGENSISIPPQNFSCNLATNGDPLNIDFTVAPAILLENNTATQASMNLDNVEGIPQFLGNTVEKFVNNNKDLEKSLIDVVNKALQSSNN